VSKAEVRQGPNLCSVASVFNERVVNGAWEGNMLEVLGDGKTLPGELHSVLEIAYAVDQEVQSYDKRLQLTINYRQCNVHVLYAGCKDRSTVICVVCIAGIIPLRCSRTQRYRYQRRRRQLRPLLNSCSVEYQPPYF
jgi:hypothetical protein